MIHMIESRLTGLLDNRYVQWTFVLSCTAMSTAFVEPSTGSLSGNPYLVWTVPLLVILGMKYSLNVESESDGDPVEVILDDKVLLCLGTVFACVLGAMVYL